MIDHKEFERRVRVRRLASADYERVVELQLLCFPSMTIWTREQCDSMLRTFVDAGADYRADFVLFSELLTLQLLSLSRGLRPGEAARARPRNAALPRALRAAGPFNTNERSGYLRVRHCAHAHCIENHVYVVLAGCTGNLPQVDNADIHYAQSAVLTPSDGRHAELGRPQDGPLPREVPRTRR